MISPHELCNSPLSGRLKRHRVVNQKSCGDSITRWDLDGAPDGRLAQRPEGAPVAAPARRLRRRAAACVARSAVEEPVECRFTAVAAESERR